MIGGRCHRAHSIIAGCEAPCHFGFEQAVSIARIIDAFEESKGAWIWRLRRLEAVTKALDRDMSVARYPSIDQGLRGGIIGSVCVCEASSMEADELDGDVESGVGVEVLAWKREQNDGGDHVINIWDVTHGNAIAGASLDLSAIGQSFPSANVDKIGSVPG